MNLSKYDPQKTLYTVSGLYLLLIEAIIISRNVYYHGMDYIDSVGSIPAHFFSIHIANIFQPLIISIILFNSFIIIAEFIYFENALYSILLEDIKEGSLYVSIILFYVICLISPVLYYLSFAPSDFIARRLTSATGLTLVLIINIIIITNIVVQSPIDLSSGRVQVVQALVLSFLISLLLFGVVQGDVKLSDNHYHGTIVVMENGEQVNLTNDKYQLKHSSFHMQHKEDFRWHAHVEGISIRFALGTLGLFDRPVFVPGVTTSDLQACRNGRRVSLYYVIGPGDEIIVTDTNNCKTTLN